MTLRPMPKCGTLDWWRWRNEFIAECYEILWRNYKPPEPGEYDPIFAKRAAEPQESAK